MRSQHDDGFAGIEQGADFCLALDADQPVQVRGPAPPQQAALEQALPQRAEVRPGECVPGGRVEFGKAQGQIGFGDAPPPRAEQEKKPANAAAKRRQQRPGQEMQQPEQGDGKLAWELFKHDGGRFFFRMPQNRRRESYGSNRK